MPISQVEIAVSKAQHQPQQILVHWLWLAGLVVFVLFVAWDTGLLPGMIATDQTYLSLLILAIFILASLHCGYRSLFLMKQSVAVEHWLADNRNQGATVMDAYLPLMFAADNEQSLQTSGELLGEQLRGQHQVGWFVTGVLIKFGLLGTVVGFVIMLASVGSLESLDIQQVQSLMQKMTQGMKVALNTTILGLVGSMLLGMQYLFLDRSADKLLAQVMHSAQQARQDDDHGVV